MAVVYATCFVVCLKLCRLGLLKQCWAGCPKSGESWNGGDLAGIFATHAVFFLIKENKGGVQDKEGLQ